MAKEADNGQLVTKVITSKVRFSFVHVFTPKAVQEGGPAKYSVTILIPKDDKVLLRKIKKAIESAKALGIPKWEGKIPKKLKTPLGDGDEEEKEDYEGFADHYYINCISGTKPGVVDKNVEPILSQDELYSGCFGRVSINFYPYNVGVNKGIAAGLNNVQKLSDGEHLGGRVDAASDFDDDFQDDDEEDDESFLD